MLYVRRAYYLFNVKPAAKYSKQPLASVSMVNRGRCSYSCQLRILLPSGGRAVSYLGDTALLYSAALQRKHWKSLQ